MSIKPLFSINGERAVKSFYNWKDETIMAIEMCSEKLFIASKCSVTHNGIGRRLMQCSSTFEVFDSCWQQLLNNSSSRVPKPRTIQVWNMPEESNKIFRCGVDLSSRFHFHFTTFLHHHRRKKKHEKLFNAKMPAGHDVKKFFVASLISRRVVEDYFRATLENFPILRYNASENWWIAQAEKQEKSLFRSGFSWVALAR